MISNNVKKFKKHELIAMVQEICAIIYYQQPTKNQDQWLEDKIAVGIWDYHLTEDDEYEAGFKVGE